MGTMGRMFWRANWLCRHFFWKHNLKNELKIKFDLNFHFPLIIVYVANLGKKIQTITFNVLLGIWAKCEYCKSPFIQNDGVLEPNQAIMSFSFSHFCNPPRSIIRIQPPHNTFGGISLWEPCKQLQKLVTFVSPAHQETGKVQWSKTQWQLKDSVHRKDQDV